MSNSTSASADDHQQTAATASNYGTDDNNFPPQYNFSTSLPQTSSDQPPLKKKRNLPGNPDPEAEVIALSPKTLQTTNRFICEICNKGFPREQNLQLHRRGHNLPWKLKQRASKEVRKKVYVCPEVGCVHHDPSRALGDLTGIKKHFSRKHGEKKWKCDKCSKKYAVQSDWKAHSKTCGTREYRCDCGTLFSRRDSFITHRAFCDALVEESSRATTSTTSCMITSSSNPILLSTSSSSLTLPHHQFLNPSHDHQHQHQNQFPLKKEQQQQDHHINIQLMPPWLVDHSLLPSSSSSIFSTTAAGATNSSEGLVDKKQNPNPNHVGPTIINNNYQMQQQQQAAAMSQKNTQNNMNMMISPHISATALLQKAAQMGATLSATSASSKAPVLTSTSATDTTTTTTTPNISSSRDHDHQSSSSRHVPASNSATASGLLSYNEMMMMNSGLIMGPTSSTIHHEPSSSFELALHGISVGGNYEGMTRDFLGLRPLSHTDILTIHAAFGNCINTTPNTSNNNGSVTTTNSQISSTTHHQVNHDHDHDHDRTHKSPWQDSKF